MNMVYRAYRVPYEWVPQLGKQEETPIERIDVNAFRMPVPPRSATAIPKSPSKAAHPTKGTMPLRRLRGRS